MTVITELVIKASWRIVYPTGEERDNENEGNMDSDSDNDGGGKQISHSGM